ncbi:MAG: ATP-binding protein [Lachnospiraceae bacterium]|nr:ATP-binding protein [Lachnospiraceae bacterium]
MKHILLKFLLFANFILFILYMGMTINCAQFNIMETMPIFLSSLILIDITYISSCNIRENKVISLFCGLLVLDSWYILLLISYNAVSYKVFSALGPVIWCVSIYFILMFLFQGSRYKFQKAMNICLTGSCICSLTGILVSDRVFALLYGIQLLVSWLGFIFIVAYHRKRVSFVFKAESKSILFSFVITIILFLAYNFITMGIKGHLSNFGIYIPVLLFSMSIHSIILKEHNSFPLSTIFSRCQLLLILLFGTVICGLITMTLNLGLPTLFLMLDAMSVFVYVCNIALEFNLKHGKNEIIKESKYHAALRQMQKEEQLNLEFANFLHDDILQDLLSIKNMINKADRPNIQKIITETLDNMNTYIRRRMHDYHPVLLTKLTIKENYQNLLEYISQSFPHRNIRVIFDCPDSLFLVEPYDIFIYRLIKELVTNIYKHSAGENAGIALTQNNGIITLCVRDNGNADADALISADKSKHRGLALITDQVEGMDGSIKISNNFPQGICIQITLPMKGDVSYQYFVSR